jgi:hypothetical protein
VDAGVGRKQRGSIPWEKGGCIGVSVAVGLGVERDGCIGVSIAVGLGVGREGFKG